MRHARRGAQWASPAPNAEHPLDAERITRSSSSTSRRRSVVERTAALLLSLFVIGGWLVPAGVRPVLAESVSDMKAVIIVGPASSSTSRYLAEGERIARQAEAEGMDVRRIYTPRATWERVKANIQGANLVVYLGHGNGWPSNMGPFRGESKDGLGLNPCEGCGTSSPVTYYGEDRLRSEVRLARNAVVFLNGLCYASGNAEDGMAPVFDRNLATQRASNFASGFLDAGAGVVFALGWRQNLNLPAQLANTDRTMDEIFRTPNSDWSGSYDGFVGVSDYYRASTRDRGARVHLDPHPRFGHLRAVTGDLEMTASEWRGKPRAPDRTAPTLRLRTADRPGVAAVAARTGKMVTISPNKDRIADEVVIAGTLSERASISIEVRDANGHTVRRAKGSWGKGSGNLVWAGRNQRGGVVKDGIYTVRLTPRDRAGNVGKTRTLKVRVLGVATAPRYTRDALNIHDGDRLANGTVLTTTIASAAKVRWEVRRDGKLIKKLYKGKVRPGELKVTWDGRNMSGKLVKDGKYQAILVTTTKVGKVRSVTPIQIGAYQVRVDQHDRIKGKAATTVHVTSTEAQSKAPVIEVSRKGAEPYRIKLKAVDSQHAWGRLKPRPNGAKKKVTIKVIGTDKRGQVEQHTYKRVAR